MGGIPNIKPMMTPTAGNMSANVWAVEEADFNLLLPIMAPIFPAESFRQLLSAPHTRNGSEASDTYTYQRWMGHPYLLPLVLAS